MVNGYESMEAEDNNEDGGPDPSSRASEEGSYCAGDSMERPRGEDTPQPQVPTTTISTIALQSGDTRLVIALLQVRHVEDHWKP